MNFVKYFIQRPVVGLTICIILSVAGILATKLLPMRLFPAVEMSTIEVSIAYPGANADVMQTRVTSLVEESLRGIKDIDSISTSTSNGFSLISVNLDLGGDTDRALISILEKVRSVRGLPVDIETPVVSIAKPDRAPDFALAFFSEKMKREEVTEYLYRVIKPRLDAIDGISTAEVLGSRYVVRIWLDPEAMLAYKLEPIDVIGALDRQNIHATTGAIKQTSTQYSLNANTSISNVDTFGNVVIAKNEEGKVKLSDIARLEISTSNPDLTSVYNGKTATVISISFADEANPLEVVESIEAYIGKAKELYPYDLDSNIIVDSSEYILGSLIEVLLTIAIAVAVVFFVLYLCTGTFNTIAIPLVTIPLSLLGICLVLFWCGYSINTLTLLAMVLAIGVVVDDAIVVYDNVLHKLEQGAPIKEAVYSGTKEIAGPIVAITITFATIYVPIMFIGGITEKLFSEFAVTLAGSVLISGVISLILTPAMCQLLLSKGYKQGAVGAQFEKFFSYASKGYQVCVERTLRVYMLGAVVWLLVGGLAAWLAFQVPKELSPKEDQGMLMVIGSAPSASSNEFVNHYARELDIIYDSIPDIRNYNYVSGFPAHNSLLSFVRLKHWDERERSAFEIQNELRAKLSRVAGLRLLPINPTYLPGGSGMPFQLVVKHQQRDYMALDRYTNRLLMELRKSGMFNFVFKNLRYDAPYLDINIDRELASELGVNADSLASILSLMYANRHVQQASIAGQTYDVVMKVDDNSEFAPEQLLDLEIRSETGEFVTLSTFAQVKTSVRPKTMTTFQGQSSVLVSGEMREGVELSEAMKQTEAIIAKLGVPEIDTEYAGESRQFIKESNNSLLSLMLGIMAIYLFLMIFYGNGKNPLIILFGCVPMAICSALIYLFASGHSLNIFTQIAILTLVGLIAKHGILIVHRAEENRLEQGCSSFDAINKACNQRFRAIAMTTLSMVLGALPLLLATGPGEGIRSQIGGLIIVGMSIGTFMTLFILPCIYLVFHRKSQLLDTQSGQQEPTLPAVNLTKTESSHA